MILIHLHNPSFIIFVLATNDFNNEDRQILLRFNVQINKQKYKKIRNKRK